MVMDKEKAMMKALLESIEEGIYIIDSSYIIEYMNPRMVTLFGEGTGEKCHKVINNQNSICPWCQAAEVFKGSERRVELYLPKVGKTFDLTEKPFENPDGRTSKMSFLRDISELKHREEKLRSSEEKYRNLFEHVSIGVYVSTRAGKFLDANQALLDMLGYDSKDEFLNIDIAADLYARPEDRRKFQEMIERDGIVKDHEVEFRKKDGTPVIVSLSARARYDHHEKATVYEGIVVDRTYRYNMERQLREAHNFMNKIIQNSPNPIMASDLKGNILTWNRASEKTLGYSAAETIGKIHITKIYPEGVAKKIMKMIRSPDHGGVGMLRAHPMLYVRKDGTVIDGMLSAAMIYDDEGREVATVGSFIDMTERIEMERTLQQTQLQLLQSEKLASMGRLTSQLAHELNNPIYGIMNTLELLKSEIKPENRRRKLLDMSLSETVRLADMLKKMLSFSKPDEEERNAADINTIMEEMVILHEKMLQEHSIKVVTEFEGGLPEVFVSKNQIRQVLLNMISNARDAMPEGGVLTFKTYRQNDRVAIDITDTGMGISNENINRIFDSFFTTKDAIKGVGLGLSVCYGFIRDHGGDIEVDSKPGEGTTFHITLPANKPDPD